MSSFCDVSPSSDETGVARGKADALIRSMQRRAVLGEALALVASGIVARGRQSLRMQEAACRHAAASRDFASPRAPAESDSWER